MAYRKLDTLRFPMIVLGSILLLTGLVGCNHLSRPSTLADQGKAPVTFNAQLAFFEALSEAGPLENLQLIVQAMAEYQSSNQQADGAQHFQDVLDRHEGQLSSAQELVYLSALGILRAEAASDVPLIGRIGWVNDTIEILERARGIGKNQAFFSRFAAGVVYAQLPGFFSKREQALTDLEWLVDNRAKAPVQGQMREVYRLLARLYQEDGRVDDAARYLEASGYEDPEAPLALFTNQSVDPVNGSTFHPQRFEEVVPNKVYLLSGLEFTEHYFIVSEDREHLIAVDAGTTPFFAKTALRLLNERVPDLPPLTTVLVTHAHWDHIGGHSFYRELDPGVRFYGRGNYEEELRIMAQGPENPVAWFFGEGFNNALLADYRPDVAIDDPTEITIGGTRIALVPAPLSETPDALFIHLPDDGTLFVGDFIMPFIGAPFVEEGSVDGLIEAIGVIAEFEPKRILHGHEPLTLNWPSTERLLPMRTHLTWLRDEVRDAIRAGQNRADIHRLNLIPPSLFDDPKSQVFFLVMREHVIDRLYDQSVGYWEADLTGLDHLGAEDYGALLSDYLDLSEVALASVLNRMIDRGDYHLAERVVRWGKARYPDSDRLAAVQRDAALRLKAKYQTVNPFKFILYSELANDPTPQLEDVGQR